jgi:hypothetical protein
MKSELKDVIFSKILEIQEMPSVSIEVVKKLHIILDLITQDKEEIPIIDIILSRLSTMESCILPETVNENIQEIKKLLMKEEEETLLPFDLAMAQNGAEVININGMSYTDVTEWLYTASDIFIGVFIESLKDMVGNMWKIFV